MKHADEPVKSLRALLTRHGHDLALLLGNGVNRHGVPPGKNAWDELLCTLARKHLHPSSKVVPTGISPTEFYDVLDVHHEPVPGAPSLQQQFCDLMRDWRPLPQHAHIVAWARRHQAPILTTNFDNTLAEAAGCTLHRTRDEGFTAFYPWESYYGDGPGLDDPCGRFAIWHVNGMQRYRQSIRLGLSHYMGSVERARAWLHDSGGKLFHEGEHSRQWRGAATWLQVMLHKPLVIIGLGLPQTEVFLRWLLVERAKYFKRFPARRAPGWYVHTRGEPDEGKALFLHTMGIEPWVVPDHDDVYAASTWED